MELDERKMKILKAIISTYLETGDPVGSRTIAKDSDLHLSSATIRNEMADLEELGYILQPHTSAGRIPSDLGYRYYVNCLMEENDEIRIRETEREKEHQDLINKDGSHGRGSEERCRFTCSEHELRYIDFHTTD